MSVLKSKRKESQFEVHHNLYKMRKEMTDLLLRDFGYSAAKAQKYVEKQFGGRPYDELPENLKLQYDRRKQRDDAFHKWFIIDQRKAIVDCLRRITAEAYKANSIYPKYPEELVERRLCQDKAIGECYVLIQELQYAIETLPVDVEKYMRYVDMIKTEINLLKGWRKSDNKLNRVIADSAANFANVNNNGNANYNGASNTNGVRPDFDAGNENAR